MDTIDARNYSILPYRGKSPRIADDVFIADGARIIGDVEIGAGSSVWFNAVIRGDVHWIRIGEKVNIQDNCMLHVTHDTHPLSLGRGITVGHMVTLHGCTVQDYCLVGIGAVVLDGALLEHHSFVAAGAVVTPNTVVKSGWLYGGIPAKPIRQLSDAEVADLEASADRYYKYAEYSRLSS